MFSSTEATMGLDLGATGLRAMEIVWRDGRPVVERWASMDFPEPIADWRGENPLELGRLAGALVESKALRARWVAHAVSGELVAPQYFNFPQLSDEDVAQAVRIEVETAVPFPSERALIAYVLFPDRKGPQGKPRTHGLAVAADGVFVENRLAMIRHAKREAFCVEPAAAACANAYLATRGTGSGSVAVLNVGHRVTNLALIGPEKTLLIRDLPWGGDNVTRSFAETCEIPYAEAESFKRRHWEQGDSAGPLCARFNQVVAPALQNVAARFHDTIQYWIGERLVPPLERIAVSGGGSLVRGLAETFSRALGAPAERWTPMAEDGSRADAEAFRLTVVFGLALRTFDARRAA